MTSNKVLGVAIVMLGLVLAAYFLRFSLGGFANVSFLAGLLFLEILIACVWKYEQRFFLLTVIAFLWAGTSIPLHASWTAARWVVLATGGVVGFIVWIKKTHPKFSAFHLVALLCAGSAFISATVSPFPRMAVLKALSLFILFLYGSGGARAAALGREQRFFDGLLWGCEIVVYVTAVAYFGLGTRFWGNPNSLGAAMSVGAFPILLWGWFTSEPGMARWRRLVALFLCTYLSFFSLARAGTAAIILVTLAFCLCMRQYRVLMKVAVLTLGVIAVTGMVHPTALNESAASLRDAVLYKGHKDEGVLGSRSSPWEKTVSSIKAHPWFGTGYGTSPTGEDIGLGSGMFSSTAETAREHGSSYMTIVEWVGLLGVLPFIVLVSLNVFHILRVGLWIRRTRDASHYSAPLAMVLLAGLIHAGFEDWMFAAGSYLCLFFWTLAFILADLLPAPGVIPLPRRVPGTLQPETVRMEAIASGR